MAEWRYLFSGLHVASEMELPEWATFVADAQSDPPEVNIRVDAGPRDSTPDAGWCFVDRELCRFDFPDVGRYCIRHGREIVLLPNPGAGSKDHWRELSEQCAAIES